ncbi:MAG: molybdopterin-dependent oxidoreductase [Acetobacteraceae bacterium]
MPPPDRPRFAVIEPGTVRRIPLAPHEMTARITPAEQIFTLAHFGLGQIRPVDWCLRLEGMVERPLRLDLDDLRHFPHATIEAVHQCAGNPLQPAVPTHRVAAVVWGGVRLADVLGAARPAAGGKFVWSDGADAGEFGGVSAEFFRKDLPLGRVAEDVLLATEVNGEPLPDPHGGPVRLVVPGFYGTNSVKWLWRMTLTDRRADGLFTTRFYSDTLADGSRSPVWALDPGSIIVTPAPGARVSGPTEITGWAWADHPVESVAVSGAPGDCEPGHGEPLRWQEALLEPRRARTWQRWRYLWRPRGRGPATLCCRARDTAGATQPESGSRNAWHAVEVTAAAT